jgi:hypothetical protein
MTTLLDKKRLVIGNVQNSDEATRDLTFATRPRGKTEANVKSTGLAGLTFLAVTAVGWGLNWPRQNTWWASCRP